MMKALSEGASDTTQATNHLNRSAGRLEDRHQNSTPFGKRRLSMSLPVTSHPPKHLVREYLERRTKESAPPPTPEEIRRQLGWGMLMHSLDDDKMGSSRS
jgi:hypothetical protein